MNSIVRALNNIAISLGRIADALNNKAVTKTYTSNVTTSTPVDNKVTITDYQVYAPAKNYKDPWKPKEFEKHKHDYIKDNTDILLLRLSNAVLHAGKNVKYHDQIINKHRKEWPSLWAVIDELVKDSKQTGLR